MRIILTRAMLEVLHDIVVDRFCVQFGDNRQRHCLFFCDFAAAGITESWSQGKKIIVARNVVAARIVMHGAFLSPEELLSWEQGGDQSLSEEIVQLESRGLPAGSISLYTITFNSGTELQLACEIVELTDLDAED